MQSRSFIAIYSRSYLSFYFEGEAVKTYTGEVPCFICDATGCLKKSFSLLN
jgi:hypothetical protein